MDRNLWRDMESRIRALRRGSSGADGVVGAKARDEIPARIRWEVSEEEVGDVAGAMVGWRWPSSGMYCLDLVDVAYSISIGA